MFGKQKIKKIVYLENRINQKICIWKLRNYENSMFGKSDKLQGIWKFGNDENSIFGKQEKKQ